jgi:hypothetical protein
VTPRAAFPPPLTEVQLGPTVKPGICAYAPRLGCGELPARFYIAGWRCEKCGPGARAAASNSPKTATGAER